MVINNSKSQSLISNLPILSNARRQQLLYEFNDTATDFPSEFCVHQLFEQQAEQTPDAIALVYEAHQLTYRHLEQRANQLAHHLQSLGVGPDMIVGVCVERSIEMLISLLGILKAGGAYVPLDPSYPPERLAYMIEDAQAAVVITQSHLSIDFPFKTPPAIVLVDSNWNVIAQESKARVISPVHSQNLVYIIYTSGSTGKPKGVAIAHHSVNRLVCNTNYINIIPQDRVAQAANFSFDSATFEIWGALLNGACITIIP
ncbi:AMP-binding protein, partial [Nostoc sp. B(2019)]|nr:AMP-binding protein [Nostoc sp. B(2019)]